jgi:CoA-transferase family III
VIEACWSALGGAPGAPIEVRRAGPILASPFFVEELLVGAAGAMLLAAADLAAARTGRAPAVALDVDRLAIAAASERYLRLDGASLGPGFDPLSAFFPARDGWVRTHGNYAWHREALLRALDATPETAAAAIAERGAVEVEEAVVAEGGCAAAVRSAEEWAASEPGRVAAEHGLVAMDEGPVGEAPRSAGAEASHSGGSPLPASGLRVLDFTRVIAGPVATRMLAALGADVVRVERPDRPELPLAVLDGGLGKRWLSLDLRRPTDRERLEAELANADAVVAGHRPGALDSFGLHPDQLAERHPHLVCTTLSAWGDRGPWGTRRGFDSLVQAATGIADALRADDRPGALPVQALDHATGYLMAAATLRALATRARTGQANRARLCLAATAHTLLAAGTRTPAEPRDVDPKPHLVELDHPQGRLTVAAPPGELDGRPLAWPKP